MNQENPKIAWYYGRTFVILMLFVVLGPLGLPFLWKSPRFSRGWRWALTILSLLWICMFMAGIVQSVSEVLKALERHAV
jgi:hypothetical protein